MFAKEEKHTSYSYDMDSLLKAQEEALKLIKNNENEFVVKIELIIKNDRPINPLKALSAKIRKDLKEAGHTITHSEYINITEESYK